MLVSVFCFVHELVENGTIPLIDFGRSPMQAIRETLGSKTLAYRSSKYAANIGGNISKASASVLALGRGSFVISKL